MYIILTIYHYSHTVVNILSFLNKVITSWVAYIIMYGQAMTWAHPNLVIYKIVLIMSKTTVIVCMDTEI